MPRKIFEMCDWKFHRNTPTEIIMAVLRGYYEAWLEALGNIPYKYPAEVENHNEEVRHGIA